MSPLPEAVSAVSQDLRVVVVAGQGGTGIFKLYRFLQVAEAGVMESYFLKLFSGNRLSSE